MASQDKIVKKESSSRTETTEVESQPANAEARDETLLGIDDLLDEIDAVLEADAQAFVKAYIQKGGQ